MSPHGSHGQSVRKVRMACRRCRTKRIKCDGKTPACGNCSKAGEPCIDVDGRNNALSIPRDFAESARARIEWLEAQLRHFSPSFDLSEGPRVDFSFIAGYQNSSPDRGTPSPARPLALDTATSATHHLTVRGKRSFSSMVDERHSQPFADEARSVAIDLGMLALNSDSRQTHYLGASSGRLFTSLIGLPETPSSKSVTMSSPSASSNSAKPRPYAHSKQLKQSCRALYALLQNNLPSEENACVLLDVYFRNVHVDHPFIHPQSLVTALSALYECAAADSTASIGFNGWIASIEPFSYNGDFEESRGVNSIPISVFEATFHVFMVFTLAATIRIRDRLYDFAPDQFYRVAMSVAHECFSSTSMATIQATMLLTVHGLLSPAEVNIWTLTHVAMAHCIDLGLHRTIHVDYSTSPSARLTRKMVFYCVYHLERSVSTIQGRPLGIRDEAFDVPLPTFEEVQADCSELKTNAFLSDTPIAHLTAFALHRFQLDLLVSQIKMIFYHLRKKSNGLIWSTDIHQSQASIRQRLDAWRDAISHIPSPPADEYDDYPVERRKHETKLHSEYYATMVLLYQPSQAISRPDEPALVICYRCAANRLLAYNDLYTTDSLYQDWRSVQGVFSSGATMVYCLWTSAAVRRSVASGEWERALRTCTNLLSVGGEWWPSVKKGMKSFSRALDALIVKFDTANAALLGGQDDLHNVENPRPFGPYFGLPSDMTPSSAAAYDADAYSGSTLAESVGTEDSSRHLSLAGYSKDQHFNPQGVVAPYLDSGEWANMDAHGGLEPYYLDERLRDHQDTRFDPQAKWAGSNNVPNASFEAPDPTIEAFITDFLNDDTSWNPF